MINTTLCYIRNNDKFLMLHRNKKENDINAEKWIGIGGKFEIDEKVEECLKREVFEETGLTLIEYEYVGLIKFESDIYEAEDMYLFLGTKYSGELIEDCNEGTLEWVAESEIFKLPTWEGDRYFLEAMLQGRRNLNMTLVYEGDALVKITDDVNDVLLHKSSLITSQHGFSTRVGGVSDGIFKSMNLNTHCGDVKERVMENWRRYLNACGIGYSPIVCGEQVHGNTVRIVTESDAFYPYENPNISKCDGYVTALKNLPLCVFSADCATALLEDSKAGVIGAIHSGWRGTVTDIEKEVIAKMISLGADLENIHVAIGPAIDGCCFEVGEEVVRAVDILLGENVSKNMYHKKDNGKYMLALRKTVELRFLQLGILRENMEIVGGCTMCNHDLYFSHRYTNGKRGTMASVIMLK